MQETQVWSLGQEVPLEKEIATHSSTPDWKIPLTEERGRLYGPWGHWVGHDWATDTFTFNTEILLFLQLYYKLKLVQNRKLKKNYSVYKWLELIRTDKEENDFLHSGWV